MILESAVVSSWINSGTIFPIRVTVLDGGYMRRLQKYAQLKYIYEMHAA